MVQKCIFFLQGKCRNGEKCSFSHQKNTEDTLNSSYLEDSNKKEGTRSSKSKDSRWKASGSSDQEDSPEDVRPIPSRSNDKASEFYQRNSNFNNANTYGQKINTEYSHNNSRSSLQTHQKPQQLFGYPRNEINTRATKNQPINSNSPHYTEVTLKGSISSTSSNRLNDTLSKSKIKYYPYVGPFKNGAAIMNETDLTRIEFPVSHEIFSETYKKLDPEIRHILHEEFKTLAVSLEYGSVFPFSSLNIKPLNLLIRGFPNYSHEEVRLAYYVSQSDPELFRQYKKVMDTYQENVNQNIKNLNSCDLETFIETFLKMEWPKISNRLHLIISKYTNKINHGDKLVEHIMKNIQFKNTYDLKQDINNIKKFNIWYTLPLLPPPFVHKVELNDPLLEKPTSKDFPTIAHQIPYFYLMNSILNTPTSGPEYLQQNSRSMSFDGAYSYDENIIEDKSLYENDAFTLNTIPLYPPSRKMCL